MGYWKMVEILRDKAFGGSVLWGHALEGFALTLSLFCLSLFPGHYEVSRSFPPHALDYDALTQHRNRGYGESDPGPKALRL